AKMRFGRPGTAPRRRRMRTGLEGSVVVAPPRLLLRWRGRGDCCGLSRICGWSGGQALGAGRRIVHGGGVLENTSGVFRDGFHASGVGGVGSLDATVVGADGFIDVTAKMIEKSAEQQSGIGGEHGVIHGIEV